MMSWVITALLVGMLASCSSNYHHMTYHFGSPWAEGRINGKGGFFLVDTGASITVIDSDLAQRANIIEGTPEEMIGTSGRVMVPLAVADELKFFGHQHERREVAVQDLGGFRAPGGRQQDGILGCDFMMDYNVIFNMKYPGMTFSEKKAPTRSGMKPHRMILVTGTPMVEVYLGNATSPIMGKLDTGSGYANEGYVYIDAGIDIASRIIGSRINEKPDSQAEVLSIAGKEILDIYNYNSARIFGKELRNVRIVVRKDRRGAFEDTNLLLVSGSLLNQFSRVEMDFPRRTIWVRD